MLGTKSSNSQNLKDGRSEKEMGNDKQISNPTQTLSSLYFLIGNLAVKVKAETIGLEKVICSPLHSPGLHLDGLEEANCSGSQTEHRSAGCCSPASRPALPPPGTGYWLQGQGQRDRVTFSFLCTWRGCSPHRHHHCAWPCHSPTPFRC